MLNEVTFKQIEAWSLLFALEESYAGVARTVYDAWFSLLQDNLWHRDIPVLDKLRMLVAARVPLSYSFQYTSSLQLHEEVERVLHLSSADLSREESFHLACDCLRLGHEVRDLLKAEQERLSDVEAS